MWEEDISDLYKRYYMILRLVEERSFSEISGILGQSDTWCRVNFFRLKKKMADALEREMGGN